VECKRELLPSKNLKIENTHTNKGKKINEISQMIDKQPERVLDQVNLALKGDPNFS